jgi:hypothetical protein
MLGLDQPISRNESFRPEVIGDIICTATVPTQDSLPFEMLPEDLTELGTMCSLSSRSWLIHWTQKEANGSNQASCGKNQ